MNTLKSNKDNFLAKLAVNKSLCKEYKTSECTRTVYLNDGDEFQIQLFNPEQVEIGAEIFIDNEPLSNIIILNPGERMWLERYTDKAKKFRFKIYTVDGESKEVEKAIAHNGEIKVKFYKKRQTQYLTYTPYYNNYVYTFNTGTPNWGEYQITCNDATVATSISNAIDISASTNAAATGVVNNYYCDTITTGSASCDTAATTASASFSSSATTDSRSRSRKLSGIPEPAAFRYSEYSDGSASASFDNKANLDLIETGRVSEGSYSSQRFETINIDLDCWPFTTEEIKILPYSRKPYTANDARKLYCPNCGRKLNTKFNFCPYCGEKID